MKALLFILSKYWNDKLNDCFGVYIYS